MENENDKGRDTSEFGSTEHAEFEALTSVIHALRGLSPEARQRVLASVTTFLGIPSPMRAPSGGARQLPGEVSGSASSYATFSEDRSPSPKDFLFQKKPQTDVERVACLAYYLTHYRDTAHFKTVDISKLNTEAAQLKLSNAAYAVDNAAKAGLLVPAAKGAKQLSAIGELYVQALPDRASAKEAISHAKPRRKPKRQNRDITQHSDDEQDE